MASLDQLAQLDTLLALPAENEWAESRDAKNHCAFEKLGKYFSGLCNKAALALRVEKPRRG